MDNQFRYLNHQFTATLVVLKSREDFVASRMESAFDFADSTDKGNYLKDVYDQSLVFVLTLTEDEFVNETIDIAPEVDGDKKEYLRGVYQSLTAQ